MFQTFKIVVDKGNGPKMFGPRSAKSPLILEIKQDNLGNLEDVLTIDCRPDPSNNRVLVTTVKVGTRIIASRSTIRGV